VLDLEALRGRARENREHRRGAARAAEELVEAKVETLARRFSEHRLVAAICELQSESSAILERELARLRQGPFVRLDDGAREAVERWARSAFGRMAHAPISAMRQLAWELSRASEPGSDPLGPVAPVDDEQPAADPREVLP
jgi:glutamyl-tRNA reductase